MRHKLARRFFQAVSRRYLRPLACSVPSGPSSNSLTYRTSTPTATTGKTDNSFVMAFSSHPQPVEAAPHAPRVFPTSGFQVIDPADKVEEEKLPYYNREEYYPMHIGDVVGGHYQVVAKLGYGTTSTVWLARDLRY